jgi:hypothetical protein
VDLAHEKRSLLPGSFIVPLEERRGLAPDSRHARH